MTASALTEQVTQQLFTEARTHTAWQGRPVSDEILQQVYDLAKFGPTSANSNPLRIVFIKSKEAKEHLKPCLSEGNIEKTMAAPVTALFAMDMEFYEHLPKLFPQADARSWFVGNDRMIADGAFRDSTLQAAYFIIAARALGLDCGPMGGFDRQKADEAFLKDTTYKSNFLCNLGYGVKEKLHPRNPRFNFEDVCQIV